VGEAGLGHRERTGLGALVVSDLELGAGAREPGEHTGGHEADEQDRHGEGEALTSILEQHGFAPLTCF
jgi:hypothetical protein